MLGRKLAAVQSQQPIGAYLQRFLLIAVTLSVIPAQSQVSRPDGKYAVHDAFRPLSFDQQKFTGVFANRLRANVEGYLEQIDKQAVAASPDAGEFLSAAADAYAYTHDFQLKQVIDRVAEDFLSARADTGSSLTGFQVANETIDGLLRYYEITGDASLIEEIQKLGTGLQEAAIHPPTIATASPLEALMALYRYTGDSGDLDAATRIVASWRLNSTPFSLSSPGNWRDFLENLIGLIELYRTTSGDSYLTYAVNVWNAVRKNRVTVTGTIAPDGGGAAVDDCVTAAWMRFTLLLLEITGQPQYASELERTVYNQLFAAQNASNGEIAPSVALDGAKLFSRAFKPCALAEARGISLLPLLVWGRYGRGIALMQYSGGRASFRLRRRGSVQIYSEAAYPESGTILLHIDPTHPIQFPVYLRVPEWAKKFTADAGESHLVGVPGQFAIVDRQWRRGDTIKISIDMSARAVASPLAPIGEVAVLRGPQVLAENDDLTRPAIAPVIPLQSSGTVTLNAAEFPLPPNWPGDQAYSIKGTRLKLVPFADALSCRVWLKLAGSPSQ
jgi:DUF1680 family protein